MQTLRSLTPEQFRHAEHRLLYPSPGSHIEAARKRGIDLTLLVEQLRLTPEERVRKLEAATIAIDQIRGTARRTA